MLMSLQKKALNQLHFNNIDTEKMTLLAHAFIYWINLNVNIENTI